MLLGALTIQEFQPTRLEELEKIWSWFEELLVGRDLGLKLATSESAREDIARRMGSLLTKLQYPSQSWHAAWRTLEPHRRRGQFAVRYCGDGHSDFESVLLIRIGLEMCASCICSLSAEESTRPLHEFFWRLYEATRRLWLTAAMDIGDQKYNLVAICIAYMPATF